MELVAVIVIIGSLSVVAVPTYLDLREPARQAAHEATMSSFAVALRQAKANWLVRGTGGSQLNVPGYAGGVLDHNTLGQAVGISVASTAATANNPTNGQCGDLLRTLVPGVKVWSWDDAGATYPSPGYTYHASSGSGVNSHCVYYYLDATGYIEAPAATYRHSWLELGAANSTGWPLGTLAVFEPAGAYKIHSAP